MATSKSPPALPSHKKKKKAAGKKKHQNRKGHEEEGEGESRPRPENSGKEKNADSLLSDMGEGGGKTPKRVRRAEFVNPGGVNIAVVVQKKEGENGLFRKERNNNNLGGGKR